MARKSSQLKPVEPDFPGFGPEYNRWILDILRSDIPLPPWMRRMIADDLDCYYFNTPARKARVKAAVRQAKARGRQLAIEQLAKKDNISQAKAKEKLLAQFGKKTVRALDQSFRRARREREKG